MKLFFSFLSLCVLLAASPLYDAIDSKDYRSAAALLKNGADPYEYRTSTDNYKKQYPYCAVCYVAALSDSRMLGLFLPYLPSVDTPSPTLGTTPLMSAAGAGNIENMRLLLEKGADVNAVKESSYRANVLMYAIQANQTDAAKLLVLKGADVNYIGRHDFTTLSIAVTKDNPEILRFLMEHGADLQGKNGSAALKSAATTLKYDFVKLLIDHGADPAHTDGKGNTILHLLAEGLVENNLRGLQSILKQPRKGYPKEYYADIRKSINALQARWSDYPKIIRYIADNGGDPLAKNSEGKTAFELADEKQTELFLQTLGR